MNFIDGVGLSAQWTPEYDFEWLRDLEHHDSQRHSREQSHSPGPGSPFSTWLPSAPTDGACQLIPQNDNGEINEKRARSGTYIVTEDHRRFLITQLGDFPTLPDFELPSRHALTRYITAFFSGFHSHFPYIHQPTYKPSCAPVELTLAMCAAGAQYCFERRSSERLFHAAKAIVFGRLKQEASSFSPQTLAFVTSPFSSSCEPTTNTRRSGPWAPLDIAKTLLTLVGYATWERKHWLQQAFALRGLLVQCLRDVGLREESDKPLVSSSRSAMWDQWVQQESARRTKLVAYCYVNVHRYVDRQRRGADHPQ